MYESPNYTRKRPFFARKRVMFLGLALLLILAISTGVLLYLQNQPGAPGTLRKNMPANLSPLAYVNPLIGTGALPEDLPLGDGFAGGNVFPGASYPHGMVQWSPDNAFAPGGYRYNESLVRGFSLTHFSGRGCNAYEDFPFMPTVGQIGTSPATTYNYAEHFSHDNEVATSGYYRVHLDEKNIQVALTVTARTGFGQFTYPSSKESALLINAGGSATGDAHDGTGVQIVGDNQVVGSASSGSFCGQGNAYKVYFAAVFDTPFSSSGTWNGDTVTAGSRTSNGSHAGAFLYFDTTGKQTVQVKVGISFVSIANARANLQQENPGWDFQAVHKQAEAAWGGHLGQIAITGGTGDQKTIFYTALYHTLFHPNIFSDVNGQYMGFDDKVHTARGYTQYENYPGWDMYRSLIGLLALLEPRETGDMLQSLVADAQQGGGALPRWEVANDNSGGMVGDSMDVVFATSYALGVRNFDAEAALRAMVLGASDPAALSGKHHPREGLSDYLRLGYVSTSTSGAASVTLEYATDDYAIAQLALALGHKDLHATYLQRSHNWEHLFDTASGYITPRASAGNFLDGFTPTSENGFIEGDSAQYSWLVPYDLHHLFVMMGGDVRVLQRLDEHFKQLNAGATSPYAFIGNEPEFAVPWEYDFADAPYRTQDVVRRIETQHFSLSVGGLPGNDDGGSMSSWYVFAALGLYPEIPGKAGFALGSPLFPAVTIHLSNGHDLHIVGRGAAENAPYVQRLSINGKAYTSAWLPFATIEDGATLQFDLGTTPVVDALRGV